MKNLLIAAGMAVGVVVLAGASVPAATAQVRAALTQNIDEPGRNTFALRNDVFTGGSTTFTVPAGKRLVLVVHNADDTPAEFESSGLGAEKVISAGRDATIRVGPLAAGRYPFADEFHQDQAHGALIAAGE